VTRVVGDARVAARYGWSVVSGQTVWAVASRFPRQGDWTERDYLALPAGYPRVELSDGMLEVLPMPTDRHQAILTMLVVLFAAHVARVGGWVRPAGLRLRLHQGRFREPDLALLGRARAQLRGEEFWSGADLVVEIVSGGAEDRARDYVVKRREYGSAGIPEYWVVDPQDEVVTVFRLADDEYAEHGVFRRGDTVTSATQDGLHVPVAALLDAQ